MYMAIKNTEAIRRYIEDFELHTDAQTVHW